jgi:hypothetical protein
MNNDFVIDGDSLIPKPEQERSVDDGSALFIGSRLPGNYSFLCETEGSRVIFTFKTMEEMKEFVTEWIGCR